MTDKKVVFLIDLDNTLIDTEKFRETSIPDPQSFPFEKYFFSATKNLLNILKSLGEVFIYSRGDEGFQMAKIKSGCIDKLIDRQHIIVLPDKLQGLKGIISKMKGSQITIIDDRASVLSEALNLNPQIKTIWIRYGKYINETLNPGSYNFVADNLDQVLDYFYPYQVKRGITDPQIKQLLDYTTHDPDIRRFTSDPKRFPNREAFDQWLAKDRTVYTLVDAKNNLLGIIWFHQEDLPDKEYLQEFNKDEYRVTFAIRMYAGARGKGLAKKFMNDAFAKFKPTKVWLSTSADNVPAVTLYQHFGFKTVTKPDQRGKIIMIYG